MAGHVGVDVARLVAVVRDRWWLPAGVVLVTVVAALAVAAAQPERYRADAVLLFGGESPAEGLVTGEADGSPRAASPSEQATNLALASLDVVAARVERRLGGRPTAAELDDAVSVGLRGNTDLVDVTAVQDEPQRAATVANAFAEEVVAFRRAAARDEVQQSIDAVAAAVRAQEAATGRSPADPAPSEELRTLRTRLAELSVLQGVQSGGVRLVERATPPTSASSPGFARTAALAAVLGLALGLLALVLAARFDGRVRDEDELTALLGAPVLARIPAVQGRRELARDPGVAEAFEFLRLNLQLMGHQQGHLVVAVTSGAARDGKTTVVAALARSLASSGADVVAVDFDLRNPTLRAHLASPAGPRTDAPDDPDGGLAEPTAYPHLRLLAGDRDPRVRAGSLGHRHVLERLRAEADHVLVDTSPVSTVADASVAAAAADGVLLVVDVARARRSELVAARRQLANARATVLGLVLNRVTTELPPYYGPRRRDVPEADDLPTFSG